MSYLKYFLFMISMLCIDIWSFEGRDDRTLYDENRDEVRAKRYHQQQECRRWGYCPEGIENFPRYPPPQKAAES